MSVIDTVRTIKKIQVNDIVMIKIGKFIYTYGKDAYIMSYIFRYKVKLIEGNIYVCAFPRDKINKVIAILQNKKVNYVVLDRRNEYRQEEQENYKNLNNYDKYLEKSIIYVKRKNQIDKIYEYLIKNIESKEIGKILADIKKIIN